jgi:nucleoid-associated protein YgaU
LETLAREKIRECISAGRIVEARTLLTMHDGTLTSEEHGPLELELDRIWVEAEALVAQAEQREHEGKTGEAKELYLSVQKMAADFPGIQAHIKRMEEALALTRAVQLRSRRIRQLHETKGQATRRRNLTFPLIGIGLTMVCTAALLFFVTTKPPRDAVPTKVVAPIPAQEPPATPPTASPSASSPIPEPPQMTEKPLATAPVVAPPSNETPTTSPPGEQPPPPPAHVDAPPLQPVPKSVEQTYTVQPGDSLSLIAQRKFCTQDAWRSLYQQNRAIIADPEKLHPGMQLRLSGIDSRCPGSLSSRE